jgi:hypothetical protein
MREHPIQQRILATASDRDTRLWRNNVGLGWAGKSTRVTPENRASVAAWLAPGDVVVRQGRVLQAGLCVGSSDCIGIRSVVITPSMVGRRAGLFAAVEVKAPRSYASEGQRDFLAMVTSLGGLAGVARSPEEARAILDGGSAAVPGC